MLLFGSGVVMGFVHGQPLQVARRIHGPAAFLWTVTLGIHVVVYAPRALRTVALELNARTRRQVASVRWRAYAIALAVVTGLTVGVATLPVQHDWLHLPSRHDHHDR
jgi:hypothetical protein